MISPGYEIYNDTMWPMQIALKQVGPLYYGLVPPRGYFRRSTGAVWFTINASVSLDNKLHITDWDAVWPVAAIVGSVALGALTGGYGAFAIAGTAAATVGGVSTAIASMLVAGGLAATKALVINGVVLGSLSASAAASLLAKVFDNRSADISKAGCYAGPPWPFRRNVHTYRVSGGPYLRDIGNGQVELVYRPLTLG